MKTWTVALPSVQVPSYDDTGNMCMTFEFPDYFNGDHHVVAMQPHLDNGYVIHHIAVYGCADPLLRK